MVGKGRGVVGRVGWSYKLEVVWRGRERWRFDNWMRLYRLKGKIQVNKKAD